jgi:solute carrier family 13 (sodium-dependent dicarboxylate transporter), member 2/3/5
VDPLIRSRHEAVEAVEAYSPAEQQFNRRRKTLGLFLGPVAFLAMLAMPMDTLPPPAHRLASIIVLMVVLWVTEAIPLAVTALVGPLLAIVLQVAPAARALASFANPIIFLFIGSFIIAEAMYVHGLDRRIAYMALSSRLVGRSAGRLLVVFGAVSTAISMWISNTATTAMMFPIGLSVVSHLAGQPAAGAPGFRRFATTIMLISAYGATIGGMATPIGTAPNLVGLGMLRETVGTELSFLRWMVMGVPLSVGLFAVMAFGFWLVGARGIRLPEDTAVMVRRRLAALGPVSAGERNVIIAFTVTVILWTLPGFLAVAGDHGSWLARQYAASMPESGAALTGAVLLFLLPADWSQRRFTVSWEDALRIDWGTVLLFGGGLAIGSLAFSTGLADAIGEAVAARVPTHSTLILTAAFTGLAAALSELTSNTAAAAMIVPVAIAVSRAAGVVPLEPALGATLGASVCFMLPISTPPNAIAYSSGYVPIGTMIKYGVSISIVAIITIVTLVSFLGPVLF